MAEIPLETYKSDVHPVWCPGCGDFGVLSALYKAMHALQLDPTKLVFVSGIGCSGRLPAYVKAYGFHVVHGRTLPVSMGVRLANPELTVVAVGGDGDGFAIGGGHIPHAARRNLDITYIIMDNETYGLTKGQVSPTSQIGHTSGSTPYGNVEAPINPIAFAITYGATFVARAYSGKPKELVDLIVKAVQHEGFAFIDAISPCITFYDTYKMIPQKLASVPATHNVKDKAEAFKLALDTEHLYMGLFYQESRPTFEESVMATVHRAESKGMPKFDDILTAYR
ncbi:MAG: 2-oxoacid:ferredoxin oxidoreductase subunit beta [Candidatus Omnitrophica bacterium]|nr:2-oxoacid:ferredoxin oxidoreductase subunit beta [Candidatus Omnitrophota bacterium]